MILANHNSTVGRRSRHANVRLRLAVVAGLAAFVGCAEEQQVAGTRVPEVTTVTLVAQTVELMTELPGRAAAYRIAEVRPRVGGVILERLFTEGADVQAGQKLYQIDSRRFAAELDCANANVKRAQADLGNARYELRRLTNIGREIVAEKEYQDAVFAEQRAAAAADLAESEQRLAALSLEWTGVVAPISGRIGYSLVHEGDLVTAEQAVSLATIQQFDPMCVDVPQSSAELLRLGRNLATGALSVNGDQGTVRLLLEDGTPYPLEGTLQFRDITVDPTTGSYTLRIVFANPQHLLLPGMFVRAVVQEGVLEDAILVPQQGVTRTPKGEPVALVVDDKNTVQQRMLKLNRAIGNEWLVESGLSAGEQLIVEGAINVRPGVVVKAVPFTGDQTGRQASGDGHTSDTD